MLEFDVVFAPTMYSITHTFARKRASKRGARIATMPGITRDMFERCIDIDYEKMNELGSRLQGVMARAERIKITSDSGTSLEFDIKNQKPELDNGLYNFKSAFGNLPAGEVSLAPREKTAQGTMVIDIMEDIAKPKTRVTINKGHAIEVAGDNVFRDKLFSLKNATNIAEFGIGINPKAKIVGDILEDEKVLGTCHVAFGSNISYHGGKTKSEIHWDAIMIRPTIWFDEKKIMDSGLLLV